MQTACDEGGPGSARGRAYVQLARQSKRRRGIRNPAIVAILRRTGLRNKCFSLLNRPSARFRRKEKTEKMSVEEFSITQCTDAEFEDALLRFNLPVRTGKEKGAFFVLTTAFFVLGAPRLPRGRDRTTGTSSGRRRFREANRRRTTHPSRLTESHQALQVNGCRDDDVSINFSL